MQTMILAVALAGALLVAGCGGGSKGASMAGMPSGGGTPTPTTPQTYGPGRTIPLPTGHILQTGTTIPAGESRSVGETDGMETVIRCTAGSDNCRFTVAADGTVTLIAGSLRIEIVGVRVVTTPTPPPTPPTRVIEPPLTPLITWRELPTLVDRMTHRTELRSKSFAGSSCDDGVTACQAVVKTLLANATEVDLSAGRPRYSWWARVHSASPMKWFSWREVDTEHYGAWLDNSIFIASYDPFSNDRDAPNYPINEADDYFSSSARTQRYLSMGIRDTNPVTGVYRGVAITGASPNGVNVLDLFELTYTSSATGGQLDMTTQYYGANYTWTNVSVDNEGYFNNDITRSDGVRGGNKLEGRFYQGGEVGGVYSLRVHQDPSPNSYLDSFRHGVFGGKLGWTVPEQLR